MRCAQRTREIAVLPQVAAAARPDIEVLRIPPVHAAQQHRQRVGSLGEDDEMYVVGHEAPSEQPHLRLDPVLAKQPQVGETIEIDLEDGAPVHAALRDVVRDAVDDAPLSPWHNLCVW